MALGKENKRIRDAFGDNGYLFYGSPGAYEQIGKTNRWAIIYDVPLKKITMSDKSQVQQRDIISATLEIDLAQSHIDEMQLLDLLLGSELIKFWGDMGNIGDDYMECYIPELIAGGSLKMETPASDNIKIPLILGIQPQGSLFTFQDTDLPTVSNHGSTVIESKNKFYHPFVAIPD